MLQRRNLRGGLLLSLLLSAFLQDATGQRRKAVGRNNYRQHDEGGQRKLLISPYGFAFVYFDIYSPGPAGETESMTG